MGYKMWNKNASKPLDLDKHKLNKPCLFPFLTGEISGALIFLCSSSADIRLAVTFRHSRERLSGFWCASNACKSMGERSSPAAPIS